MQAPRRWGMSSPETEGTHDLCSCHPSLSHTDSVQSANNAHNRLYVHLQEHTKVQRQDQNFNPKHQLTYIGENTKFVFPLASAADVLPERATICCKLKPLDSKLLCSCGPELRALGSSSFASVMLAVTPSLLPYSTVQLGPPACMQQSTN